jgi:hypothetical protein
MTSRLRPKVGNAQQERRPGPSWEPSPLHYTRRRKRARRATKRISWLREMPQPHSSRCVLHGSEQRYALYPAKHYPTRILCKATIKSLGLTSQVAAKSEFQTAHMPPQGHKGGSCLALPRGRLKAADRLQGEPVGCGGSGRVCGLRRRQDHSIAGVSAHHAIVGVLGAFERHRFDLGAHAGEHGELHRVL